MNSTLARKIGRDLAASPAQTMALVFVVALGIASFIALVGAYRDLDTSYRHTYEQLGFADVTFAVAGAPVGALDDIAGLPGVAGVSGRFVVDTGLALADDERVRSRLIGLPPGAVPPVNRLLVEAGSYLADDAPAALLESHFAAIHDFRPGDTIRPLLAGRPVSLDIVGIVASPEYIIVSPSRQDILPSARTFAVLFVPLPWLQEQLGRPDLVNSIAIRLESEARHPVTVAAVAEILKPYGIEATLLQEDVPSNAALQQDLAGYRELAVLMPGIILAVAAISVYAMLGRTVRAQQPQIGVMKAVGYSNSAVLAHYLAFALLIGIAGTIVGIVGGVPLSRWITATYAAELGIPLIATRIHADLVGFSVLLSLLLATLAGLGPAWHSSRMAPAEAIRLDPTLDISQGRTSLFERLVRLPLWLRLPSRNVMRMRRRAITTWLGIIFAFVLVLMVWGLIDSMNYHVEHFFEDVERWDISAVFGQPQTRALLDTIGEWEGVRRIEPTIQLPATVHANGREEDVLLIAFDPTQPLHALQLSPGLTPAEALGPERLVLTQAMADTLGVGVNDAVILQTPFGERMLIVGGMSDELMSAAVYLSLEEMRSMMPLTVPVFNGLYLLVDVARARDVKAKLYELPGTASVHIKADARRDWEELLGLFYLFTAVMMAFAVAMALALIFNAMTVNVMERQRELATMRAIGAGAGRIALQIALENIMLWLLALAPGLLLGRWTAIRMGEAFSAELFTFDVLISPSGYLITALGILATMLVASVPAMRRVNRLDLAQATKVLT